MSYYKFDYTVIENKIPKKGTILIAILNWGLGHASRSIALIKELLQNNHHMVIASDGQALTYLKKTFPELTFETLPAYRVKYTKNPIYFQLNLFSQLPKFISTYFKEKKSIKELVKKHQVDLIISDNRFGVFHKDIPSYYITHQIKVLSGWTSQLTSFFHQRIIEKYDECWVPDIAGKPNLSGELSHDVKLKIPIRYLGILSQYSFINTKNKFEVLAILSGPEPQRSQLEGKLLEVFKDYDKPCCLVKGLMETEQLITKTGDLTTYNYALTDELQKLIASANIIITRSGYSTIMDLAVMKKKALFIPTPGQTEQEYLAHYIQSQKIAPFVTQDKFELVDLEKVKDSIFTF